MKNDQIFIIVGILGILFAISGLFLDKLATVVSFILWIIMGLGKTFFENQQSQIL